MEWMVLGYNGKINTNARDLKNWYKVPTYYYCNIERPNNCWKLWISSGFILKLLDSLIILNHNLSSI